MDQEFISVDLDQMDQDGSDFISVDLDQVDQVDQDGSAQIAPKRVTQLFGNFELKVVRVGKWELTTSSIRTLKEQVDQQGRDGSEWIGKLMRYRS